MSNSYRKMMLLSLILLLTVGVVVGCGANEDKKASKSQQSEASSAVPVEIVQASSGEVVNYITVTGTAKAAKTAQLTPQIQETVQRVLVEEGDEVKAGERLIQLEQSDIKAKIDEAQAGLETAQAGLEELLAGTREEEIDKLQAQVEQARANYEQAEKDYERYKKLFNKDVISKQQFESKKTGYISAKSSYQTAQESLKMAQRGPTKEQIKTQQAKVRQSEAQLHTARLNLAKTALTAPFTGLIAEVEAEKGEMVGAQPIVSLVDLSSVEIQTYVSEKNINKLEVGQGVTVNFNAFSHQKQGKIKNIGPSLNQEEQGFPVEIEVDNGTDAIKAGMYAEIKIETQRSAGNLVIPKRSLLRENGSNYVFVVENNKAVKKEVRTGLSTVDKLEVLAGIEAGDKVVTVGSQRVTDGYAVRVVGGGGE